MQHLNLKGLIKLYMKCLRMIYFMGLFLFAMQGRRRDEIVSFLKWEDIDF